MVVSRTSTYPQAGLHLRSQLEEAQVQARSIPRSMTEASLQLTKLIRSYVDLLLSDNDIHILTVYQLTEMLYIQFLSKVLGHLF